MSAVLSAIIKTTVPSNVDWLKGVERAANGAVKVFTDGSCKDQGNKLIRVAGLGVWFGDKHPANLSESVLGKQNNQRAELCAFVRALEISRQCQFEKIIVYSDNEYTLGEANRMRKMKKPTIVGFPATKPNLDILAVLAIQLEFWTPDKLEWDWVKAHDKSIGNNMADKLAKNASAAVKSKKRKADEAAQVESTDEQHKEMKLK
jgi:ribonuclease HI